MPAAHATDAAIAACLIQFPLLPIGAIPCHSWRFPLPAANIDPERTALSVALRASDLEQDDGVEDEQDPEDDRPTVEVPLDQRSAPERASGLPDAERAGEPRVLPRMEEDEEDQDDRDDHLEY